MTKQKRGFAPIIALIIILLALGGGGAYYAVKKQKERNVPPGKEEVKETKKDNETAKKTSVTLSLNALNDSGQKGTAVLTDVDGIKTKVVVEVGSGPAGIAQPAHIHLGACPSPGAVTYPLKNVVNGRSETMLDVALITLKEKLPLALNVHKSAEGAKVYVACGDLPKEEFDKLDAAAMMQKRDEMIRKMDEMPKETMGPKPYKIEMTPAGFSPKELTIKKGDKVEFINRDTVKRWPASGPHPAHTICQGFDSKPGVAVGESYSFTFSEAKTCPFHDHLNPSIFGKIIVE